jgi:signal transduction histidine kinase
MHDVGRGPSPTTAAFARKLAHDLNNFATVVRTYSELLLTDLPPGGPRDDVGEIHRAADAMVAYLQRVARFARTSALRPAPRHVLPIVRDVVTEFAEARDQAPVQLGETTEALVDVDPSWLRDVVRELVINAREAAPPDSTITIAVLAHESANDQRWAIIEVRDAGPGFAESVAGNAEDPFVTTKDGVRGAGFGLTLACAFADASGGRLMRTRDAGTTRVALWLPVQSQA